MNKNLTTNEQNTKNSEPLQPSFDDLPLSDELISAFLQDNPDYFQRNPQIINSLRLNDNHRGTVSLVERQQQQLRQKIHDLEDEITQLMSVANQNEQLFTLYSDLYLRLLDCHSADELIQCIHQTTTELLSLSDFKLWLTPEHAKVKNSDEKLSNSCLSMNDCAGVMQNRLTDEDYYFGRLQQSEQQLIFSQNSLGSVVLVKLVHQQDVIGFFAISSDDTHHFDPRMDTLLLSQFKKLVAKLLSQQLS